MGETGFCPCQSPFRLGGLPGWEDRRRRREGQLFVDSETFLAGKDSLRRRGFLLDL